MDYSGKIIRKNPVTPSQTSASGVWTLDEAMQATKSNTWPVANVPDPISRSLRFRNAAGAYLNRTPATAGNRRTWTWSAWVKRGFTGDSQFLFSCWTANNDAGEFDIYINPTGNLIVQQWTSSFRVTNAIYRDPSAWYHVVVAIDTTQATAGNRVKVYVNGSEVTSFSTTNNPTLNQELAVNQVGAHYISSYKGSIYYLEGYMAEAYFIDGQALTPSSFGGTNAVTGVWEPRPYTGTYGTNGFLLTFSDITSTATLGNDTSGNSNNWTTNNISLTAGSTYDSMLDVPTQWIGYNTGDVASVTRGNYCVVNPLNNTAGYVTVSAGNLNVSDGAADKMAFGTMALPTTGKWYFEYLVSVAGAATQVGLGDNTVAQSSGAGHTGGNFKFGAGGSWSNGDLAGVAIDMDAGTGTLYKNNSSYLSLTGLTGTTWYPCVYINDASGSFNFGQRPFSYTPPAGFLSLCTTNLPSPTILQGNQYFDATTYTGNGTALTVTNSGSMSPDFVWIKERSSTSSHRLVDAVRGVSNILVSNSTTEESSEPAAVTALNSNGFSVGANFTTNEPGDTYVGWQWDAGTSTVTNTSGSISAQVRANTTAGFSVVTFTATGSNATVGHGLGAAPSMIITKQRNVTGSWATYHESIGNTKLLYLNSTGAALGPSSAYWNNTSPTSSVFTFGGALASNTDTIVAYCFAAVPGYSAFGSYVGNGSENGPFIYTGFRPRYVMIKRTDSTSSWAIFDTSRNTFNVTDNNLFANLSDAESTFTILDILSNGFKIRTTLAGSNASGGGYIYAAFAESPFKNALAR
jgi:hypothetical protein